MSSTDVKQIIIRVAGLVIDNDKVLLVKHKHTKGDYWIFPGGGLIAGERLEDGTIREVFEETGMKVRVEKMLYVNELLKPEKGEHMLHITFLCVPVSGEVYVGSDPDHVKQVICDAKFIPLRELVQMQNFLPPQIRERLLTDFEKRFEGGVVHLK